MYLSIKNDAIFVADSHFNQKNKELLSLLKKIESNDIVTSQLFLMGDIFDFISGESRYFIKQNQEVITLLNKLALKIKIVYLEGNHDYNLQSVFPNIKVIKRENQPFFAKLEDGKTVALSHGDNFINWKYDAYCKFIRNTWFLKFMNFIDFNYFISKKIEEKLVQKNICHKITNFENIVKRRVQNYDTQIIIEGHYHQGKEYLIDDKRYINIPSLCCQKEYVKLSEIEFRRESL